MNIPFTAIHFSAYETMKRLIDRTGDEETLATQLLAGGTAGAASAACTNPLDVVKTRLQTDGMLQHRRHLHSSDVVRHSESNYSLSALDRGRLHSIHVVCAFAAATTSALMLHPPSTRSSRHSTGRAACRSVRCGTSSRRRGKQHCGMAYGRGLPSMHLRQ